MRPWLKLWRKTKNNKIFRHDPTAWHVFEILLLCCDEDTGIWEGGRFILANLSEGKSTTTYKALKRLEKAKMVTLSSNNKYTTIQICKWTQYQTGDNTSEGQQSNNKVTTKGQQSNTLNKILDIKTNKTKKNTNTTAKAVVASDFIAFKETWKKVYGKNPVGGQKLVDFPIQRLIQAYTLEKVCNAIMWAEANRATNKFIPSFNNPLDLERKWNSLVVQAKGGQSAKRGVRL
jgi:hypothetical protein